MRARSYVLGLVTAAAGLGVAELVDGLYEDGRSPVVAAAEAFRDRAPSPLTDWAIETFGTADKAVLVAGAIVVIGALGVIVGLLAARRSIWAAVLTIAIGVVGGLAVASRPDTGALSLAPTVAGSAASLAVLVWFWRGPGSVAASHVNVTGGRPALDRRRFMSGAVLIAGTALAAGGTGRVLGRRFGVAGERESLLLPVPDDAAAPLPGTDPGRVRRPRQPDAANEPTVATAERPAGPLPGRDDDAGGMTARDAGERAGEGEEGGGEEGEDDEAVDSNSVEVGVPGVSPFVTSNERFYRIDTALVVPQLLAADWRLRVHGMVDREITMTFDELVARPQVERYLTLSCVSNEVGGMLVGNALWQGALLGPILAEAGVHAGAEQLVSRSVDGWTCGTPVADVMDGRDALLAVRMNGEPLPTSHGYPVRMVVPGLYGYVSATKWVVDLELTTWDAFDAYWVPRGWSQQAPFKLTSRIDTPRDNTIFAAGRHAIAGVAWHPHVGIAEVQVQIDGGDWQRANLAAVPSKDTWRQWVFRWDADQGGHTIRVRAINETGQVQDFREAGVMPDGSSGYHEIDVLVTP